MNTIMADFRTLILRHLHTVRRTLGLEPLPDDCEILFADALDSMGMVELLGLLADDCGVTVEVVERAANRRFETVATLARDLAAAGLSPTDPNVARKQANHRSLSGPITPSVMWLSGATALLPERTQHAAELDALLGHPPGWFATHAGITKRHLWGDENALSAAGRAGRECLEKASFSSAEIGALLVASESPPNPVGTAASLHHLLGLAPHVPALEIGNACTGFLAALWTAQRLLPNTGAVLVIVVEVPSRFLEIRHGPAGESAALFSDGAAACLLTAASAGPASVPIRDIFLGTDGGACDLLQVQVAEGNHAEVVMDGPALASRAVRTMARVVTEMTDLHGLTIGDLSAVIAHGGNGRMPALLARTLGIPSESVWSLAPQAGNLGSASLPAAWSAHKPIPSGLMVWVTVGAGLQWGAALSGTMP